MSTQFKWEGTVLVGRVAELNAERMVAIPPGPPASGSFSSGKWFLQIGESKTLGPSVRIYYPTSTYNKVATSYVIKVSTEATSPPTRVETKPTALEFKSGYHYSFVGSSDLLKLRSLSSATFEMHVTCPGQIAPASPEPASSTERSSQMFDHLSREPNSSLQLKTTLTDGRFCTAGLSTTPVPFDVKITFPCTGKELWVNSTILKEASPYFSFILDSELMKATTGSIVYEGTGIKPVGHYEHDWSDSDDDGPPPVKIKTPQPTYTIAASDHSFNTYQAVWLWILTGQITFAPLSSSLPATSSDPPLTKRRRIDPTPSSTLAVSPKSVYRLAHKLQLTTLKSQALNTFKVGLKIDNVACELFSSTAYGYDEVRAVAAEFAVQHWSDVEKTDKMREMQARVEAGSLDSGGKVSMALAKASLARSSKA